MRITLIILFVCLISISSFLFWEYHKYSEKKILITGEILNYNKENLQMPTEVILEVLKGSFGSFEEYRAYYIFKIQKDGKFIIKDVSGRDPEVDYRSIEFNYRSSVGSVKSKTHIIIEDIFALKKSIRDYEDEKYLKFIKMY